VTKYYEAQRLPVVFTDCREDSPLSSKLVLRPHCFPWTYHLMYLHLTGKSLLHKYCEPCQPMPCARRCLPCKVLLSSFPHGDVCVPFPDTIAAHTDSWITQCGQVLAHQYSQAHLCQARYLTHFRVVVCWRRCSQKETIVHHCRKVRHYWITGGSHQDCQH
jgi:hypothetical protein